MKRECEITVQILTERTGFDMPLAGLLGGALGGNVDLSQIEDLPADAEPVGEDEEPEGEPFTAEDTADAEEPAPEKSEFFAVGKLVETEDRVEIVYEESVLTGMDGSLTSIGFAKAEPEVISMVRQGFVDTAMVFEAGKRHITVYQTPFAEFELSVCALKVSNLLLREGVIELDYVTELHGARTERCKMNISIG